MQQDTHSLIGVLFPGQGSQEKGMGRDVAEFIESCVHCQKNRPSRRSSWPPLVAEQRRLERENGATAVI